MTKKFFALLMAVVMVLALSVPALAEDVNYQAGENVTITVPEGRAYAVYQIFTGDLAAKLADGETSDEVLSNIKWGVDGTGTTGTDVDKDILEELEDVLTSSDTAKLAAIEKYVSIDGTPAFSIAAGSTSVEVPVGYYLIKDLGEVEAGSDYSLNVVQVVGPTKITPKTDTTTSEKTVADINDSTDAEVTLNGKSADFDIGDTVPFQLKATIAGDFANYVKAPYKLTFHDTESAGLIFDPDSVVVTITYADKNADPKSKDLILGTDYTLVTENIDSETFQVRFANLNGWDSTNEKVVPANAIAHAGDIITVDYNATLSGENVKIGAEGNPNTLSVSYSNNPNDEQGGEEGTTPPDVVVVFTFELDADKIDGATEQPLKGAGFKLYKFVRNDTATTTYKGIKGTWVQIGNEVKGEELTTFTWKGIDDGYYKLEESTTPSGYNTMEDLYFEVWADHSSDEDDPTKLVDLGSKKLDKDGKEVKTSDATDAPTVEPFEGTISTGVLDGDIINNSGSVLPETGGIGTTIFYVVGAVLVVGAAVILFAKKKVEE